MMVFLALLPGVFVVRCWGKASGLGGEGQYPLGVPRMQRSTLVVRR